MEKIGKWHNGLVQQQQIHFKPARNVLINAFEMVQILKNMTSHVCLFVLPIWERLLLPLLASAVRPRGLKAQPSEETSFQMYMLSIQHNIAFVYMMGTPFICPN